MNKARRKEIAECVKRAAEIGEMLNDLRDQVTNIMAEEEDYRDNMPENMQQSERYYQADSAIDALSQSECTLETIISSLTDDFPHEIEEAAQ